MKKNRSRIGPWPARPSAGRARADTGDSGAPIDNSQLGLTSAFAYQSDSLASQELGGWNPWLRSPDSETNLYRDRRVARTRDVERNDGWARGTINTITDDAVGGHFMLIPKPDFRALARAAGPGFDATWAHEFASVAKSEWRAHFEDPAMWFDAARQLSGVQIFRLGLRHKVLDGENTGALLYQEDKVGPGLSRYATRYQSIDPDRLSNPHDLIDRHNLRGGVEIDDNGAPIAYHFRRAHQNDMFDSALAAQWERVERETWWGRPQVIHDFDLDRIGQNRGLGVLTPVLAGLKMITRSRAAELQQALLQTVLGTFVESPFDPEQLRMAMEAQDGAELQLSAYQQLRDGRAVTMNGVRIPTLVTGERIGTIPPRHPNNNFEQFEGAALRNVAAAAGTTAEAITRDYSKANYSSLRAAMLGAWRTLVRRRMDFGTGTCTPIYGAWLEEFLDRHGRTVLPRRAPEFMEERAAYMRCRWIGPGRGWVDPVKERQGAQMGLEAGFGTLEDECAEIGGAYWEEVLDQREIEVAAFKQRNLVLPAWAGMVQAPEPAPEFAGAQQ